MSEELVSLIKRVALENAVAFKGVARAEAVLGKLLGTNPGVRSRLKELLPIIREVTDRVNRLTPAEQAELLSRLGVVEKTEKTLKQCA